MIAFPPMPELPEEQRATADLHLRFEDLTQDGRLLLPALTQGLDPVWNDLIPRHPAAKSMRQQGVLPILSRMIAESVNQPFSIFRPFTATAGYRPGHTATNGEVDRIVFTMWSELSGPASSMLAPRAPRDAPRVPAGRVFAEHVLTRPFAPPGERKVLRMDFPGVSPVPEHRVEWRAPIDILALPEGAAPLEPDLSPDAAPTVFGVMHTDSNQHVNSLVYPRLFEEAAVRRFAALGKPAAVLGRFMEIGFRKPCFAGEAVRVVLRAFELGKRLGAVGAFVTEEEARMPIDRVRPRCCAMMLFER
jgi:Thioesterase superfamily